MENVREAIPVYGQLKVKLRNILTGEEEVFDYRNIVCTEGLAVITDNLTNASPTHPPRINYVGIGTGTNTPAASDTQLQAESYRKAIASQTSAANILYNTAFFTAAEVSGTFREIGLFINASGTANSGQIFNRAAINITKSLVQTMTVDFTHTLTPV